MSKTTIKVGSKNCKCAYEVNTKVCKKSKISCDKKCSGKASGVELDGYKFAILVKKGKVTIQKCEADGSTGGSGNVLDILVIELESYYQGQLVLDLEADQCLP